MEKLKSADATASLIIGFLIAFFSLIVLRAIAKEINLEWQKSWNYFLLIGLPVLSFLIISMVSRVGKKFLVIYQLIKFFFVGTSNVVIDLGILNILMWLSGIATGIPYILFRGFSAAIAIINSYAWNKHWTFKKKNGDFYPKEFLRFMLIVTVGFLIDISIAGFIVIIIGPQYGISEKLWANFGAFAALLIAALWNFTGYKLFVFKK